MKRKQDITRYIKGAALLLVGICVLSPLLILPGCGREEPAPVEPQPREIPLMTSGNSAGLECMVVTNEKEYSRFISRARKREDEKFNIDFDRYILLTAWGDLPSSGYKIFINRVSQTGTRVDVQVDILYTRSPDMGDLPVVIFDSYFVCIERGSFQPRGELKFVFHDRGHNQLSEMVASV